MSEGQPSVIALTGGVGGARLARGLHLHLPTGRLACAAAAGQMRRVTDTKPATHFLAPIWIPFRGK